jgi:hypothetical protein
MTRDNWRWIWDYPRNGFDDPDRGIGCSAAAGRGNEFRDAGVAASY